MIKEITYLRYITLLLQRMEESKLAYLNCNVNEHFRGTKYFESKEGISFLRPNGYMGGLCRIIEGDENLSKIHQEHRINLGGTFFDCYDGKLVSLYKKQGFTPITYIPFNSLYAKKGWREYLSHKPSVVIMSIYNKPVIFTEDFETAFDYATYEYKYITFEYRTNQDKRITESHALDIALSKINKNYEDISTITEGFGCIDFGIKNSRTLIRRIKYNLNLLLT